MISQQILGKYNEWNDVYINHGFSRYPINSRERGDPREMWLSKKHDIQHFKKSCTKPLCMSIRKRGTK